MSLTIEQCNRGKRSIGLDFSTPDGRALLYELAAACDVFMTNLLPGARRKLGIDVEDIRARSPGIVYVRADAVGPTGAGGGKARLRLELSGPGPAS